MERSNNFLKILLFSQRQESFAGPVLLYAVAFDKKIPFAFSSRTLFQSEKRNTLKIKEKAKEVLLELQQKIVGKGCLQTLIGFEKDFEELYCQSENITKKFICVAAEKIPELENAKNFVSKHLAASLAAFNEEYPQIDLNLAPLGIYDTSHPELAPAWKEFTRKKRLLLHICCGPDAGGVIRQLKNDYELVCFWYDPNIQPREEYDLRLEAFKKVAAIENVPYIVGEYDVDNFFEKIKGFEHSPERGAKCSLCYDMRLERSALEARTQGCELYATTLAISPHKVQEKLRSFGKLYETQYGIPYLARNFSIEDGFKNSVEYSHENDIYRQDYCGCIYSLADGGPKARAMAEKLKERN